MNSRTLLWQPTVERMESSNVSGYLKDVGITGALGEKTWKKLYEFSIFENVNFWSTLLKYSNFKYAGATDRVLINDESILDSIWFPDMEISFVENLLFPSKLKNYEKSAIVYRDELGHRKSISYNELRKQVLCLAKFFLDQGISAQDRIVAILPNCIETVVSFLAASYVGAIFSSSASVFGANSLIDRFEPISPSILIYNNSYFYSGKNYYIDDKIDQLVANLPSLRSIVALSQSKLSCNFSPILWDTIMANDPKDFKPFKSTFNTPLCILFSSGTTGKPKAILHSVGGTLIEHYKELVIHTDLKESDTIFYQTNCSWMMWNWLISSLMTGATIVLYEGSPVAEETRLLFKIAKEENISIFGTNPKFLSLVEKNGVIPIKEFKLDKMRTILSTGSPLSDYNYQYVYRAVNKDVCLSSISGGTDILGCFGLGSPILPVRSEELQSISLGYQVEIFDQFGNKLANNEKGELVCTNPFPSRPLGFWNDNDNQRFIKTYFLRFPNVWYHGDYAKKINDISLSILGRSDATLNPKGVRVGTAEIYREVEKIALVKEALAIGQNWNDDVRILLFVTTKNNLLLTEKIKSEIKLALKTNCSPYHVPDKIIQISDIPTTKNGKIVEIAVANLINQGTMPNLEGIDNPDSLEIFLNNQEIYQE